MDVENTLIGRNPNEPQTVTLKIDKNDNYTSAITKTGESSVKVTSNIEMQKKRQIKDDKNPLLNDDNNNGYNEQKLNENEEKDLDDKELLAIQKKGDGQEKRVSANTEFLASAWQEEVDEMEKEDQMAELDGVRVSINARLINTQRPSQIADTPQSTAL